MTSEQRINEVADVLEPIARALGIGDANYRNGWTVIVNEEIRHGATLADRTGRRLWVCRDWRNKERLSISGQYPGNYHDWPSGQEAPKISVSAARGAEVIAREITRRMLPDYDAALASIVERVDRREAAERSQAATVARLADIPGASFNVGALSGGEGRYYGHNAAGDLSIYGDLRVNCDGSRVEVKLSSLPIDLAEAVLKLVAGA